MLLVSTVWVTSFSDLLIIMDNIVPQLFIVLLNAVITIALTWILVPIMAITGAIVAFGCFTVLGNVWILPIMARRHGVI